MPMETSTWRKASRSANEGQCVEVFGDLRKVRDSKNAGGPELVLGDGAVPALTDYLKRV